MGNKGACNTTLAKNGPAKERLVKENHAC
jgi:hypothetical protein